MRKRQYAKQKINVNGGNGMKRIGVLIFMVAATTWFIAGAAFGEEGAGLQAPQDEIVIAGEQKSARFSHPVHLNLGITCGQCHHNSEHQPLTDKDIEAMTDAKQLHCATCHNSEFSNASLQSPKDAFHARCKECHKTGVNGKMGPTKCTDCHIAK
jgi:hypothetical protein